MNESLTNVRAADALVSTMRAHGVDRVFCVPGESYLALLDALHDEPGIDVVVARHEGGGGLMAVADAKVSGRPGVCLVSRGPGAMNAAMALHVAEQDATPLILVVGQVARVERGRGAFQEMDYAKTFSDSAKAVWEVSDGAKLAETFAMAWQCAMAGTPGPTVISVAEDAFADQTLKIALRPSPRPAPLRPDLEAMARVRELLSRSKRPLVIAGGDLTSALGRRAIAKFAERHGVPVATSYKRQDVFDNAHPLYAGHLGFKIAQAKVDLLQDADLVLAVGTRLGDVTTQGHRLPPINGSAPLVHVHPDGLHLGRLYASEHLIQSDGAAFLDHLAGANPPAGTLADHRAQWAARLNGVVQEEQTYVPAERADGLEFGVVVEAVARLTPSDAIVVLDAGNFASWVHRLWPFRPECLLLGTLGGAMGIAVPGAVAAALREPSRRVVAFVGDGGFMMTGAELATAVATRARLVVFVAQNRSYGTIRQHQELAFPGRAEGTDLGGIDFAMYARSCGAVGFSVSRAADVHEVVSRAMACDGPCVVDVRTSLTALSAYMTLEEARTVRSGSRA